MADAIPSRNPASDDSLVGLVGLVLSKFLQSLDDMLPARVVEFDRAANRVRVQPLIRMISTVDEQISRAPIASLPVFQYGGGGMLLSFNLKPGDLGWIKANDRDISQFLRGYAETAPNTQRMHSFSDAVFIPDAMRGFTINGEDDENAVLQTLDGSVRVALWDDRVKITAGELSVEVGPLLINVIGPVTFQNLVTFAGGMIAPPGTPVTLPATTTIDGLTQATHRHTNVTNGPNTSGGPAP